ncbi:MAG: hypothetical protein K6C30_09085 [Bacteroidaceae bacterium]|nr:hypothetical protein [Bacteroidaceae bacterium]
MKKFILTCFAALFVHLVFAQEAVPETHLTFEKIEIKGDIYDFAKSMNEQGYKVRQRDLNQLFFVFKGNVFGKSQQFKVSFSKKTKTVWRVMVQPHNMPIDELLDSLTTNYGAPYEALNNSYKWLLDSGFIQLMIPEGYDPTLVFIDSQGAATYKDEDNRN